MKGLSFVALGALVVAIVAGCGTSSSDASPTPYPTLIPLGTPSPSAPLATLPPVSTPSPDSQASGSPALQPLPAEFTRIPKAPKGYAFTPSSKQGISAGSVKNTRLGTCGLNSPIDYDGSAWDPMYGDDGQGGPLTDDQLNDLRSDTKVALTLVDAETLQLVTRHGATITLVRHDGNRRYPNCG